MGLQNPIPFYFFSLIPFFFFNLSLEAPGCLAQGLDVLHKPLGLDAPHCSALESPEEARSVTAGLGSAMVWPPVATRHGHEAGPRGTATSIPSTHGDGLEGWTHASPLGFCLRRAAPAKSSLPGAAGCLSPSKITN